MKSLIILISATLTLFATLSGSYGQGWTLSTDTGIPTIAGIAAADSDNVWACQATPGTGGIFYFNGTDWTIQTDTYAAESGEHRGAYALDPSHVWVVGNLKGPPTNQGRIYYYNGSAWAMQTEILGGSGFIYDAYASDSSNVWATGNLGYIYRTTNGGGTWAVGTDTGGEIWNGVNGVNDQNVWAAGGDGSGISRIAFYNGIDWAIQTEIDLGGLDRYLRDVTAVATNDVWACGDTGMILHYNGTSWNVFTDTGMYSKAIWAADTGNIWAISVSADVLYFNGTDWVIQDSLGTYTSTASVDGSAASDVWAGIYSGQIYRRLLLSPNRAALEGGDYNGDGTSDIAVFRESSGLWAVRGITRIYFGAVGDRAVPGDYNGSGTSAVGIFRAASGLWALRGVSRIYFGGAGDIPVPGDYTGDGTAETGIFRAASGLWAIRGLTRVYFGSSSDTPEPGYYTGADTRDIGIFRAASGLWAIRAVTRVYFGGSTDETVPGDFDGSGTWEAGIFRGSSGLWAIRGVTRSYFGGSSDLPSPADYDGNSLDDIGIFRAGSGLWAVRGVTRVYFGTSDDVPVTR